MWSLEVLCRKNAAHCSSAAPPDSGTPWPIGQAVTLGPPELSTASSLAPIRIASTALLSYAELALGFDLDGLRRGLIGVLRAERGLSPDETVALDPLTVLAFATAMAPEFVAEQWVEPLSQKLARYQDWPVPSFTLVDRAHGGVRIRVVDRVAVKVLPARRRQ